MTSFDHQTIKQVVAAGHFTDVYYFPEIGSTNDFARQLAKDGAPSGALTITDYQSAGRGRKSRTWDAAPGVNLLMSLLVRPTTLKASDVYQLVIVSGLAIVDAVEAAIDQTVAVKWPNDLQMQGRKFCGILPESSLLDTHIDYAIIGMGINVNQKDWPTDDVAQHATSLYLEAGHAVDRLMLLSEISMAFGYWYQHLNEPILAARWRERCTTLNRQVQITQADGTLLEGRAMDVQADGTLLLETNSGVHQVSFGDASLRS